MQSQIKLAQEINCPITVDVNTSIEGVLDRIFTEIGTYPANHRIKFMIIEAE